LGQHSIFPQFILVINLECLLIPVIVFANHRRHFQGWHSSVPQLRQHPEFVGILHHRPTELETGRDQNGRFLSSVPGRILAVRELTVSLEIVRKRPSAKSDKQEAKKRSVSVDSEVIGAQGGDVQQWTRY
jgi:hypothetical protein